VICVTPVLLDAGVEHGPEQHPDYYRSDFSEIHLVDGIVATASNMQQRISFVKHFIFQRILTAVYKVGYLPDLPNRGARMKTANFAQMIKDLIGKGWTQEKISERTGIPQPNISRYQNGGKVGDGQYAIALSQLHESVVRGRRTKRAT